METLYERVIDLWMEKRLKIEAASKVIAFLGVVGLFIYIVTLTV